MNQNQYDLSPVQIAIAFLSSCIGFITFVAALGITDGASKSALLFPIVTVMSFACLETILVVGRGLRSAVTKK